MVDNLSNSTDTNNVPGTTKAVDTVSGTPEAANEVSGTHNVSGTAESINNASGTTESADNVPETNSPKRGRGRPRKAIADNVAEINNVPKKRGPGRPRNAIPTKYYGEGGYYNITLHIDPKVGKALKIMAIREEISIGRLVSEAVAAWLKWLAKANVEEAKKQDRLDQLEDLEKELQEMIDVQSAYRKQERKKKEFSREQKERHKKALKKYKKWIKEFPDRPWPWFGEHKLEGTIPSSRKRGRPRKEDNVAEIKLDI